MKHEWRKKEKDIYLPKNTPTLYNDSEKMYITVLGKGHPDSEAFSLNIELLFALSYSIRMMQKNGVTPEGYYEYTVYPLEGIWDLSEEGRKLDYLDKNHFVYQLMIRQPDFMTKELFDAAVEHVRDKKKHLTVEMAKFELLDDGFCAQMMHHGSYDDEPATFRMMDTYCEEHGLTRIDKRHKEIYITDARKTAPEKLKTVIRYKVSK
ncbi:GyrI-like domain-containing protein [Paenisporosarcina indica]|uniref:GyrI-like domain-containing protein n=1 Tax=Paenisporosarcina indica TaxID=650093 RepID=UPI00094F5D82|nr:GyrI-like domain-containing protein [Paenisporosarcina indica]